MNCGNSTTAGTTTITNTTTVITVGGQSRGNQSTHWSTVPSTSYVGSRAGASNSNIISNQPERTISFTRPGMTVRIGPGARMDDATLASLRSNAASAVTTSEHQPADARYSSTVVSNTSSSASNYQWDGFLKQTLRRKGLTEQAINRILDIKQSGQCSETAIREVLRVNGLIGALQNEVASILLPYQSRDQGRTNRQFSAEHRASEERKNTIRALGRELGITLSQQQVEDVFMGSMSTSEDPNELAARLLDIADATPVYSELNNRPGTSRAHNYGSSALRQSPGNVGSEPSYGYFHVPVSVNTSQPGSESVLTQMKRALIREFGRAKMSEINMTIDAAREGQCRYTFEDLRSTVEQLDLERDDFVHLVPAGEIISSKAVHLRCVACGNREISSLYLLDCEHIYCDRHKELERNEIAGPGTKLFCRECKQIKGAIRIYRS